MSNKCSLDPRSLHNRRAAQDAGVRNELRISFNIDRSTFPVFPCFAQERVQFWQQIRHEQLASAHLEVMLAVSYGYRSCGRAIEVELIPLLCEEPAKNPIRKFLDGKRDSLKREVQIVPQMLHRSDLKQLLKGQESCSPCSCRTERVSEDSFLQPVMNLARGHSGLKDMRHFGNAINAFSKRNKPRSSTRHPAYLSTRRSLPTVQSVPKHARSRP